jgi:type IV pilus assembly protein PilO
MNIRDTQVQKGILGIVLVIALAWLIFFTAYLPFSTRRTSVKVDELRTELQTVAGELQRLKSAVNSEISSLLTNVTTAGMKAGVQFTLFEPGQAESYELYTRYPVRITVTGGYHQVGRFFDNLCNMGRLVGISNVGLTQLGDGEEMPTVEASATISAYAYKDAAGGAAPQLEKQKAQ